MSTLNKGALKRRAQVELAQRAMTMRVCGTCWHPDCEQECRLLAERDRERLAEQRKS